MPEWTNGPDSGFKTGRLSLGPGGLGLRRFEKKL